MLRISTQSMTSSNGWDIHQLKLPDGRRADLMQPSDLYNELVALGVPNLNTRMGRQALLVEYAKFLSGEPERKAKTLAEQNAELLAEREQLERKYAEVLRLLLEPQDVVGRGKEIRFRAEEMLREAAEREAARKPSNPERQPDPAAVTVRARTPVPL